MKKTLLAALAASASLAAFGASDLTASLEFVGAPNVERWPSNEVARHVPDLCLYQGRIYQSGGDWENNGGPCPIFAIEPYTGNWEQEWIAWNEWTEGSYLEPDDRFGYGYLDALRNVFGR